MIEGSQVLGRKLAGFAIISGLFTFILCTPYTFSNTHSILCCPLPCTGLREWSTSLQSQQELPVGPGELCMIITMSHLKLAKK